MNKDLIRKQAIIAVVALLISFGIAFVYVFDPLIEQVDRYPDGLGDPQERSYFKINPETILAALDRGEIDVFMPELAIPQAPLFDEPISWHQSDHMKAANALYQFVWKEPLDDWHLYYMHFNTACHDELAGFGFSEFSYFKTVFHRNGQIGYTARGLSIYPQYGYVISGGSENFPHPLSGWKSINLDQLKITAEDALRIADENGGKAARLSFHNKCLIRVRLSGYTDWRIRITEDNTASEIFRMEIDPYTGEIK